MPPKASLSIPVSCVEAGRWREVSREFTPVSHAYHSSGRRAKVEQVSMSLRSDGARSSDQGAIWSEIEMKSARMGSNSRTRAASAMYDKERRNLDRFVEGLRPQEGQVGARAVSSTQSVLRSPPSIPPSAPGATCASKAAVSSARR